MRWLVIALCLLCAAAPCARAQAQVRSVAEELRVNAHAGAVAQGDITGVGTGLSLGYGSSRRFVPFFTYDRARVSSDGETFRLRHMDAGARLHARGPAARIVPFGLVAWTWRAALYHDRAFLGDTLDVKISGAGPTVGVGVLYYVRPRIAVETSAKWTGGDMSQATTSSGHFDAGGHAMHDDAFRLNIGVSWFPLRAPAERSR